MNMNTHNFIIYIISSFTFFISCNGNLDGCTDIDACNYSSAATVDDGTCHYPLADEDCEGDCIILSDNWTIQVKTTILPWNNVNLEYTSDNENYFGANDSASDNYDAQDIPEPPLGGCSNCLSAYFIHGEWNYSLGSNFTQDFRSNEFCESKEWILTLDANCMGSGQLEFNFTDVQDNLMVFVENRENTTIISDDQTIDFSMDFNAPEEFKIKVILVTDE